MRKLFDDLLPTPGGSPHNRKSVRTNSPETKSNKKGLEVRQNKIVEKGQSIIRNIALKNWAAVVNANLRHDLFAPEFKDVLARKVAKEYKDYTKLSCLKESSPHQLAVLSKKPFEKKSRSIVRFCTVRFVRPQTCVV